MAIVLNECPHERFDWNRAEPDVGIFLPYYECLDCGMTTTEYDEDVDAERDEDGVVYATLSRAPRWEFWFNEDDFWCEVEGCELPVRVCACGECHCETHPCPRGEEG